MAALGVVAVAGTDYVRRMLAALEAGQVTVPLRGAEDAERIARGGVTEVVVPEAGGGWLEGAHAFPAQDRLATISFTSGTEGMPKAVHLSQAGLQDTVVRLNAAMEVTAEIREYVGVPPYHSFGYGRCRAVLAAGGRCFLPENGFDLAEIRRMLQAGEINAISAVPSLWRLFLQQRAMFGAELGAVRWVEIGSQYMAAEEKRALRALLPNAKIVQHYGLTEASRTTFLRIDTAPDERLGSVGRAEGAIEVEIAADGHIRVRGPHVAMGVDDGTGFQAIGPGEWFETNDRGHLEEGWLYFDGRADDVINCAGIKLVPDLIEAELRRAVPEAGDFAVLRCDDARRGDGIMLALTPGAASFREALVEALDAQARKQGLSARSSIVVREVETFPRTATGKLQRKVLAQALAESAPSEAAEPGFAGLLRTVLGAGADQGKASFQDLGGDSLGQMQIHLALEQVLGAAPAGWEAMPLAELRARVEAAGDFTELTAVPSQAPPLPRGDRNENPKDISFWKLVSEDFRTNDSDLFHQGFLMLLVHRFGNWRMDVRPRILRLPLTILYRILNKLTQILFGMKLDYTVKVGRRVKLEHFGGMILGAREIGNDVTLRQNTTLGIRSVDDLNAKPVLGAFVDVGAGAVIVGNISIGENSIIGANSVVFTSVPPNSVVMGVPARIIGTNTRRNPSPLR